jgi:hypothetical protein
VPILRCQRGVVICTSLAGTLKTGMAGAWVTGSQSPVIETRKSASGIPAFRFPPPRSPG